mmetsp:Transcript_11209/g.16449  ORF Transcript_11209/g.16449 Transcript_11209/m.16449 type:complete len:419 (-) Transcript_11209:98-1354(-)|eukprot:CAMPEP_0194220142 /NCGR_PEP_ID=MMETSP0156-20130528/27557_1 /TAXON_ID=33649 /ORGANISM="Thalassionema nitzschioides, Strain L26-B" /LENGTH=418 /DNA_ID=CAMNT_0038950049 /DNA_START=269 /DNA_END=1525 /DNA_ORIENTATION=+
MNNEAFRDLVRGKSTKEIAREAVEDEFRRKEKRKRRVDDCSSDDDNTQGKQPHKKKKKEDRQFEKEDKTEQDTFQYSKQYRDRAKERREGKNLKSLEMGDSVLMKYPFGGCDTTTHITKGLDVTLARKVKQETLNNSSIDSTRKTQKKKKAEAMKKDLDTKFTSVSDARKWIKEHSIDDVESSLGKSILSFLQESFLSLPGKELSITPLGLAIQRSTVTFSMCANASDRQSIWMIPQEQASMVHEKQGKNETSLMDLDSIILSRIVHAFENKSDNPSLPKKEKVESLTMNSHSKSEGSDSDDIFDDVGDYVPTVIKNDPPTSKPSNIESSHFDGLVVSSQQQEGTQSGGCKFNIVKKFVQKIKAKETPSGDFGVFGGEYGEDDMDVDFSGQLDGEEEATKPGRDRKKNPLSGSDSDAS